MWAVKKRNAGCCERLKWRLYQTVAAENWSIMVSKKVITFVIKLSSFATLREMLSLSRYRYHMDLENE